MLNNYVGRMPISYNFCLQNAWTEWIHMAPADTKTVGVKGLDMK